MKRQSFTLIELLTVIAIMAILAGILMPTLGSARARARTSSCASNQGQVTKFLQIAMDKNDNKLYSGTTADTAWTRKLYDKNIVSDLKSLRCTEIPLDTALVSGSFTTSDAINETAVLTAYGMVAASGDAFNFKGTRLLRDSSKNSISPSALALGGCSITSGGLQRAVLSFSEDNSATLGNTGAIHGGSDANIFFLDGHVENLDGTTILEKYYPYTDSDVTKNCAKLITKWLTKDKAVF